MEEVFAMTAKLQLPVPLRERIHEYYEHLCMNTKAAMLHLDVRVYLPNDFIMRQGEVDVEFYMVNRGYCELDRDSNRFERVTPQR
ncbi:Cyclic nucleotide-binding-like [Phytophthora cactorum]|nr:Cyclic nucleotide-binding-like [Phytophthora cactorum]